MEEAVSPPDATNHPVVIVEEDLPEDCDNEWLRTTPKPKPKLFSYDWAKGYISPFRATPLESLKELCKAVSERQLLRGDWKDQIVYDLGCGDGKVNIQLAKEFGTRGVGLDLDGHLISQANALAESEEVNHLVSFKVEDILKTDLSDATVLFLYLLPDALEKLKPILELALAQPGVILIVEQWPLVNWDDRIVYNHNQNAFRVYSLPEKRQDWNTQSQAP